MKGKNPGSCPDISNLKLTCSPSETEYGVLTNGVYMTDGSTYSLATTHAAGPCVTVMHFSVVGQVSYDLACSSNYFGDDVAFFKCMGTFDGNFNGAQYFEGNWNAHHKQSTIRVLSLTGNEDPESASETGGTTRRSDNTECKVKNI